MWNVTQRNLKGVSLRGPPSNRAQQEWRSCRSSCGGILVDAAMPLHLMGIIRLMKKDAVVFPSYSSSPRQSHRRTDPKCNPLGGPSHSDDWFSTSIPQAKKKSFACFLFGSKYSRGWVRFGYTNFLLDLWKLFPKYSCWVRFRYETYKLWWWAYQRPNFGSLVSYSDTFTVNETRCILQKKSSVSKWDILQGFQTPRLSASPHLRVLLGSAKADAAALKLVCQLSQLNLLLLKLEKDNG